MLVRHSGSVGDIVYALWCIRELSRLDTVDLLLVTDVKQSYTEPHPLENIRLSREWAESLSPLLLSQSYINSVEVLDEETLQLPRFKGVRILDLDHFRLASRDYQDGPCWRWYDWALGTHSDPSVPSLDVTPLPDLKDVFVIARTSRNHNPNLSYATLAQVPAVFVGLREEYDAFRGDIPHIRYHPTGDWLTLARLLAGSRGLIANQGAVFALAEALKIPRLLEVPFRYANVHPTGGLALEAKGRTQWESGIERLTGRRKLLDYEVRPTCKKVFVHVQDDTACSLYRAVSPCHFTGQLMKGETDFFMGPSLPADNDYDVIHLQRVIRGTFLKQMRLMKQNGKKFVWDTDDDFFALPPSNPAYREVTDQIKDHLSAVMEEADYITVTTEELKKAIHYPEKTYVLPNLVDPNLYPPIQRGPKDFVHILWAGSFSHDADLDFLEGVHKEVRKRLGDRVRWTFFGYHPTWACTGVRVQGEPVLRLAAKYRDVGLVEGVHLSKYPATLAYLAPDIALCPLVDDPFNARKSAVKAFEYALAGAAVIASDVAPYRILERQEGILVPSGDMARWVEAVLHLVENEPLRYRMNAALLKKVHSSHSWWSAQARQPWVDFFRMVTGKA